MEPKPDTELSQLLQEWQAPTTPPSLEKRVLASCQSIWVALFKGSIRVPVPVAAVLAVFVVYAAWHSVKPTPVAHQITVNSRQAGVQQNENQAEVREVVGDGDTGVRKPLNPPMPVTRIENITSDLEANAVDTRFTTDGGIALLELMAGQRPSSQPDAPLKIAPPPYDPFELVTSRPSMVKTAEMRIRVINLLRSALQKREFNEPMILPRPSNPLEAAVPVPYAVKVSFNAGGQTQDVGAGEMEETRNASGIRRWTGHVGSFSLTRIILDRSYDMGSNGPIPMRLQMVREIVLGNWGGAPPDYTTDSIRTAIVPFNGSQLTCILISPRAVAAANRDWSEKEYCIDSRSEMLRVYSAVPGIYVTFDYNESNDFHGHVVPDQFTATEAGSVVLKGSVKVNDPDAESLDAALFTPTGRMATGDEGVLWPISHVQSRSESNPTSSLVQPIIVHATLLRDGSVVEAEALQASGSTLSRSAVDLVKKTKYDSDTDYLSPSEQEIFVTVE